MPYSGLYTLGFDIDSNDKIWAVGQDLRMFNGATWAYYNYQNSAVPSAAPFKESFTSNNFLSKSLTDLVTSF